MKMHRVFGTVIVIVISLVTCTSCQGDTDGDDTTVDNCVNNTCMNGAPCVNEASNYTCTCTSGWEGWLCDKVDYCVNNTCANDAPCVNGDTNYTCNCTSGWEGWLCDKDIDDCQSNPCENGNCTDAGNNNFTCACTPGWLGYNCSRVDHCFNNNCGNGSTCKLGDSNYTCACVSGFEGWLCDQDVDDCKPNPCQNSGNCTDKGTNAFSCDCTVGWTGQNCTEDVKECENKPCKNGTCEEGPAGSGTYTCACDVHYTGKICDTPIDNCNPNPCNGGTCINGVGTFTCNCTSFWMGDTCKTDVDECTGANPCGPTGYCQNTNGNFTCYCNDESNDVPCPNTTDYCKKYPCGTNQVCENAVDHRTCTCTAGFELRGKECKEVLLIPNNGGSQPKDPEIHGPFFAPGGLPYFGETYWTFYVSQDGYITLDKYWSSENPLTPNMWPNDVKLIAPLWSHWDIPSDGSPGIFVTEYSRSNTKHLRALTIIDRVVNKGFNAEFALVVSWIGVVPFPASEFKGFEDVTFQAVVATDGSKSYLIFAFSDLDLSDIGFVTVTGYSKRSGGVTLTPSGGKRYVYELFDSSPPGPDTSSDYRCLDGLAAWQKQTATNDCPCSSQVAQVDERFIFRTTTYCAESRFETIKCCYDKTNKNLLINDLGAAYTGENNTALYTECCGNGSHVCKTFFEKFPSSTCSDYERLRPVEVWGNPVSTTNTSYIFNGIGEYFLVGSQDSSGSIIIQGRYERLPNVNITVLTAIAVQASDVTVEAALENGKVKFYFEGDPLADGTKEESFELKGKMLFFRNGVYVKVREGPQLLVSVFVPNNLEFFLSEGLVSAIATLDLAQANKTKVNNETSLFNYTLTAGNFSFINDQIISPESFDNYTVYQDVLFDSDSTKMDGANTTCGYDIACLVEFSFDETIATQLVTERATARNQKKKFELKPPTFSSAESLWRLNISDEIFSTVVKADPPSTLTTDAADYTYNATTGVLTWNITGLKPPQQFSFSFVSENSDGLKATFKPAIVACLCSNKSQCDPAIADYLESRAVRGQDEFFWALCRCPKDLKGDYCETANTDVCHNQCFHKGSCNDSNPSSPCTCPENLVGDGIKCYDENECKDHPCGEFAVCTNMIGNYSCACWEGFRSENNKCQDINECDESKCSKFVNQLTQYCVNTLGLCQVGCKPRFEGENCTKYVPYKYGGQIVFAYVPGRGQRWTSSLENRNSEEFETLAKKVNTVVKSILEKSINKTIEVRVVRFWQIKADGARKRRAANSETPKIGSEYEVLMTQRTSEQDLKNAMDKGFKGCATNSSCVLGDGADQLVGVDRRETTIGDNVDNCKASDPIFTYCNDASTKCVSGNGTFRCECLPGFKPWELHDFACEDIDECMNNSQICGDQGIKCINLPGSYQCTCEKGYTWSASEKKCLFIDHCRSGPCKHDGSCINTGGDPGYACKCPYGWTGATCNDKDSEAERQKTIIIAVSASLGALCLILIIAVICLCRRKHTSSSKKSGNSFDVYDEPILRPGSKIPRPQVRSNADAVEMVENLGSKTNLLLVEEEHALKERQESFNKHTSFNRPAYESEAYENPAYNGGTVTESQYEHL